MTPLQAAKDYCANYQANGTCLGIAFRDDLSMYKFRQEGLPCLLCNGQRCVSFEAIIVPMRMSRETPEAKTRADKKERAVRAYLDQHALHSGKSSAKRVCLDCRRVELQGQAKFCERCALKRKLASTRAF
jgi:hypothetical protein